MKAISIRNDSTSQRSLWKFSFIALILICLLGSLVLAGDEETPKAVRRTSPTIADSAAKKVALVIGNKDYKDASLRNPVNDAEDLGLVLRRLGFSVIIKTNVNPDEFEDAISQFSREIANAHVAVFYFSGHGCQAKGDNCCLWATPSILKRIFVVRR